MAHGHVAYVEGIVADGMYISECASGTTWMGIRKIPLNGDTGWGSRYTLNGYIYLDLPI